MTRWRVLLVGVLSGLLVLAHLYAPRPAIPPAWAQGVGIFSRATCTQWNGPITGQSFCFEQSTNTLKFWTGAAWVTTTATQSGVNNIRDFGAKVDVKSPVDGAMTLGSPTILGSLTATFTASDVGKSIAVAGAGASAAPLRTTIATVISAASVTLTNAASTAVSGAQFSYGTDDTTAWQAAIDAFGTTGQGVVFFCGRTKITNTLSIRASQQVSIQGCGADQGLDFQVTTPAALIDNQSSNPAIDLVWSSGAPSHTEIHFTDFAIDSVAAIASKPFPAIGIRLDHFQANSTIERVNIRHHDIGIQCTQLCFDFAVKNSHFENLSGKGIYIASHGSQALYEGNTLVKIDSMAMDLRGFGVVVRQNDWEFIGSDGTNRITNGCANGCVSLTSAGGFVIEGNYAENNGDLTSVAGRANLFITGSNSGMITGNYFDPVCSAGPACPNPIDRNIWLFNTNFVHVYGNYQDSKAVSFDLLSSGTSAQNYQWGNRIPGGPPVISGFVLQANNIMFASANQGNGIGQDANFTWNGTSMFVGGTSVSGSTPTFGVSRSTGADFAAEVDNSVTTAGSSFGLHIRAGRNASDYALLVATASGVNVFRVYGDGGVTLGNPTGGSFASGTINNASATYMNGLPAQVASATGQNLVSVRGLSASQSLANNLSGTCTFSAAVTCTVAFANNEPDANYKIMVGGIVTVSAKARSGFLMTATGTNSNAVDWFLVR